MHFTKSKITLTQTLIARMVDELAFQSWAKTKDGQKGRNRPESILKLLTADKKDEDELVSFMTADEFDNAWKDIVNGKYNR